MKCNVQYLLQCYTGEDIFEVPVRQSSEERSTEDKECSVQKLSKIGIADDVLQMINENPLNLRNGAELNAQQRQEIRVIATSLKTAANKLRIRSQRSLLAVERAILQNEGLNADEMQVVNNIHAIKTTTTVSKIAECLGENLTSRTLRAALRFLCYSATSVPEELAMACELAKVTYPRIRQLTRSDSIYDAISEFIEDRLESIIH